MFSPKIRTLILTIVILLCSANQCDLTPVILVTVTVNLQTIKARALLCGDSNIIVTDISIITLRTVFRRRVRYCYNNIVFIAVFSIT